MNRHQTLIRGTCPPRQPLYTASTPKETTS